MTDLSALVADLTRLQAAATPAPWKVSNAYVWDVLDAHGTGIAVTERPMSRDADAALIVASRNALPHLLARLAELENESAMNLDGLVCYRDALHRIMQELGVPGPDYPAPVANAYEVAYKALSGSDFGVTEEPLAEDVARLDSEETP